ncbi:MAG TPA: DUF2723 domain-containing protein [Candidatus Kapabacteria bacterium]
MQLKPIHYTLAALSFLIAAFTYLATMQPSIPFWDCGEFLGAAATLGISHPPGAPFWIIVGRLAELIVPLSDLAARCNTFSALCGAMSAMFLYLTTVRVIKLWRGNPQTVSDVIVHYGGAFVAALAFTWSDSVWFNSSEFIVFAPGLFFICCIIWLGMIWHEHANEVGSEKYLLLIFYLLGLSMGAHQMSMLAFFPVWVIVYYKHWPKMTVGKWAEMLATGTVAFLFIFLVVLTGIVGWLGGAKTGTLTWIAAIASVGLFIYYWRTQQVLAKLILTGACLVFLGYSTYTFVMIRGAQDPPMDQHHPSTFGQAGESDGLYNYISRAQYGEAHEFPRRNDDPAVKEDPMHARTWDPDKSSVGAPYTGSVDFWWRYQTDHMYIRYLLWNFVGRHEDVQDSGTDWTHTLGIPFLIGLFGIYWQFRRDPKRALAMMAGFLLMGIVTAWYQNQQDMQPRERDYFYVGSFWIFAMWIGIGVTGIMEMLRAKFAKKQNLPMQDAGPKDREVLEGRKETIPVIRGEGPVGLLAGTLALAVVLIPLNQCFGLMGTTFFGEDFHHAAKWGEYSRYHNYVPLEYAYNILQSCPPDAILFTAGDNDTFPLWCIQDMFHIRTDVRIINLSLANMGWYVKQLKDEHPFGAKTINLPSFTEEQLLNDDETPQGIHTQHAAAQMVSVHVSADAMKGFTGVAQPYTFSWRYTSQHQDQNDKNSYYYEVADQIIRDAVVYNINDRPICFAVAVPPSYWVGLDNHAVFDGLVARIVPTEHPAPRSLFDGDVNESLYTQVAYRLAPALEAGPYPGMILNSFRDPKSNRSGLDDEYGTTTYFELYARLANHYLTTGQNANAKRALDTLSARMPPDLVDWDYQLLQATGQLYQAAGDTANSIRYIKYAAKKLSATPLDESTIGSDQYLQTEFRKGDLYMNAEMFDSARAIFSQLRSQTEGGNQTFVDFRLAEIDAKSLLKLGQKQKALDKYNQMLTQFAKIAQMGGGQELAAVQKDRNTLAAQLGIKDTATPPAASGLTVTPGAMRPATPGSNSPK